MRRSSVALSILAAAWLLYTSAATVVWLWVRSNPTRELEQFFATRNASMDEWCAAIAASIAGAFVLAIDARDRTTRRWSWSAVVLLAFALGAHLALEATGPGFYDPDDPEVSRYPSSVADFSMVIAPTVGPIALNAILCAALSACLVAAMRGLPQRIGWLLVGVFVAGMAAHVVLSVLALLSVERSGPLGSAAWLAFSAATVLLGAASGWASWTQRRREGRDAAVHRLDGAAVRTLKRAVITRIALAFATLLSIALVALLERREWLSLVVSTEMVGSVACGVVMIVAVLRYDRLVEKGKHEGALTVVLLALVLGIVAEVVTDTAAISLANERGGPWIEHAVLFGMLASVAAGAVTAFCLFRSFHATARWLRSRLDHARATTGVWLVGFTVATVLLLAMVVYSASPEGAPDLALPASVVLIVVILSGLVLFGRTAGSLASLLDEHGAKSFDDFCDRYERAQPVRSARCHRKDSASPAFFTNPCTPSSRKCASIASVNASRVR